MESIRERASAGDRLVTAAFGILFLWVFLQAAGHVYTAGIADQLRAGGVFDSGARRLDIIHWWVPLHLASTAAVLIYGLVFYQKALPIARHHRSIAVCGLIWCLIMVLNLNHALGMPLHEDVIVSGVLVLAGLVMSLLLLLAPAMVLAYGLFCVIALSDLIAGAWLLLWQRFGSLPSASPLDLDHFLNPAFSV